MSWFANALVLIGLYLIGSKYRGAFLFTAVGEVIWCGVGIHREMYDLVVICAVFAVLAVANWFRWGKDYTNS